MEYTALTMTTMLGNQATDADAEQFAAHLERRGWELSAGPDGQIQASRHGAMITESEWDNELKTCFN